MEHCARTMHCQGTQDKPADTGGSISDTMSQHRCHLVDGLRNNLQAVYIVAMKIGHQEM